MQVNEISWSEKEQEIAKEAFNKAYERETSALINEVCSQASRLVELDDLWKLHDFLSARRHYLDGKYDYSCSELIFTFASLVKEGWLQLEELQGLENNKLSKVAALMRI
ncbi:MAG: hypothetical protein WBG70_01940 [Spirulinaceae cyanobacterium]